MNQRKEVIAIAEVSGQVADDAFRTMTITKLFSEDAMIGEVMKWYESLNGMITTNLIIARPDNDPVRDNQSNHRKIQQEMKNILKEYIDILREKKRLEDRRKELLNQLLHVSTTDDKELGDVVLKSRCRGRELIIEALPDDVDDDDLWLESHRICDNLFFLKEQEEIEAGRIYPENYGYGAPDGNITDGSHEGW